MAVFAFDRILRENLDSPPILPEYVISRGKDYFLMRTWEGNIIKYENHPSQDLKSLLEKSYN